MPSASEASFSQSGTIQIQLPLYSASFTSNYELKLGGNAVHITTTCQEVE